MTLETLQSLLGWCSLINLGLLLWWFCVFSLAHDSLFKLHSRWFQLTPQSFDHIHYAGMAFLKLSTLVFNLGPYIALRIIL